LIYSINVARIIILTNIKIVKIEVIYARCSSKYSDCHGFAEAREIC
jgi:hypothetical protein